eukprot:g5758.t1
MACPTCNPPSAEPEDPTDWEEWDASRGSFVHHMIAGSAAGVLEHTAMFPVDTVKTHSQCARCGVSQSPWAVARDMVREQGPLRMWRGVSTMFSGCVPAHAAYFSIFEALKRTLGADRPGHHPLAAGAAGAMATVAHDIIMTPMDVAKQRLQLGYYNGMWDLFRTVLRQEGAGALYRSFPTTLLMNVPYGAVMVSTNESLKRLLNPTNEQNLAAFLVAGAGGGLVASLVTCPLDVAKTRLQTQGMSEGRLPPMVQAPCAATKSVVIDVECDVRYITINHAKDAGESAAAGVAARGGTVVRSSALPTQAAEAAADAGAAATQAGSSEAPLRYQGLADALRQIIREDGWRGLMRGAGPRVMVHAPAVAISWGAYETFKRLLSDAPGGSQ